MQVALAMRKPKSFLVQFWSAKSGAVAIEYALILAIVCCGIAVGASKVSDSVNEAVIQVATCLSQPVRCLLSG
jgi:Flp pilus assembly pilin Flp